MGFITGFYEDREALSQERKSWLSRLHPIHPWPCREEGLVFLYSRDKGIHCAAWNTRPRRTPPSFPPRT